MTRFIVCVATGVLLAGLTACGDSGDRTAGPTVADAQQKALAAAQQEAQRQQDPAVRYPPLPVPEAKPLIKDRPDSSMRPPADLKAPFPGEDPVSFYLQRVAEFAVLANDDSYNPESARRYMQQLQWHFDQAKDDVDGDTRDKINDGIKSMNDGIDRVAAAGADKSGDQGTFAIEDVTDAAGKVQLAVYYYLKENYKPHGTQQLDRDTFCSPTHTYVVDC